MSERIANLILAAPKRLIVFSLLVTLAIGSGAGKIRILDDLTQVVPADRPVRQAMTRLENTFGPSETLVVMARNPDGSVYDQDFLGKIYAFQEALAEQRPFHSVQGLAGVNVYERDADGGLVPRPILPGPPQAASEVSQVQADLAADEDLRRAFVSLDAQSLAIYVDPKKDVADSEILSAIDDASQAMAPYDVHITGMPVVRDATTRAIRRDMAVMIPIVVLVLIAFLWATFRTISGVLLTVLIVGLSILPGAGLMGFLGVPMTAINNTFPVLILAIACAGAIHFLSIYYRRLRDGGDRTEAVRETVHELALPVFIAALTTAAGFLSLLFSPIPPIGTLGWVVALGVIWAWWLTTFVLPAVLLHLKIPGHLEKVGQRGDWFFQRLARITRNHSRKVLVLVTVVLAVIGYLGLPHLKRETRVERFFTEDTRARADSEIIDKAFRGSTPLEIIVEENVESAEVLQQVAAFSSAARAMPEVGSVDSIVNIVARIQEGFTGTREIPDDDAQVAQAIFMYSLSASPEQYQRFVATDAQSFRVTVRLPNLNPEELEGVITRIDRLIATHLDGLTVHVTGKALFLSALNEMVVRSAVRSVGLSLGLVFLICLLTFRELRAGIHGMAPLFVAVFGVFGIMGIIGIPMTIASALVSAIVIGVGVDYGVHVLARWRLLHGTPFEQRVSQTIDEVGRPILLNAVSVGCGLGVLALSRFQPIRHLGALSIIAMFTAAMGAMIVIPALKSLRSKEYDLDQSNE